MRECRAMIQALHSAGLGVVMDVVYNHTYYSYSWLERTVPGLLEPSVGKRKPDQRLRLWM